MKQILLELQGEINESFLKLKTNSPLTEMDRFSWQKMSKDIVELNGTMKSS
jgi:hypothetical protein